MCSVLAWGKIRQLVEQLYFLIKAPTPMSTDPSPSPHPTPPTHPPCSESMLGQAKQYFNEDPSLDPSRYLLLRADVGRLPFATGSGGRAVGGAGQGGQRGRAGQGGVWWGYVACLPT